MYTTGELADLLKIHTNTIRVWCSDYAAYLSSGAGARTKSSSRSLSERDALILATIADLRAKGLSHTDIRVSLDNGNLIEALPVAPSPEEQEAREAVTMVPIADLNRALDQIMVLRAERDRLISERDSAVISEREANTRINDLQREIGRLEGQIQAVNRGDWWLRFIAVAILILAAIVIALLTLSAAPVMRG